ncbi:Protein F37C4.5 [Paramyrothecium foliicola]|nr:Protein F37C4.5 [Paramyrothecium foliicola]
MSGAEAIFGIVAGGAGLLSLSIQLGESAVKLKRIYQSAKDAQKNISNMVFDLETLALALQEVEHERLQSGHIRTLLLRCTARCQESVNEIQDLVERIEARLFKHKGIGAKFYATIKEPEVTALLARLDSAKSSLNLAYIIYFFDEQRRRTHTTMDSAHKAEYNIRDLSTRAVILFPTRAQIFRDIKSIPLQPGTNEIVINGLSPTVDDNSIKVEGNGAAIISDIAIEALPNRELFEDRYPESDSDADEDDPFDTWVDDDELARRDPEIKAVQDQVNELNDEASLARELVDSAEQRLNILDAYNKTLDAKNDRAIEHSLEVYKEERAKAFEEKKSGLKKESELSSQLNAANRRLGDLLSKARREIAKADKAKVAEKKKAALRRQERIKERERVRKERQGFWPKYCYTVRITLEANVFTPASSRRASISSDIDVAKTIKVEDMAGDSVPSTCDLVLSYVTTSAYWSPNYDLQLSTTNSAAALCFDAQLNNSTSETWEDCKVTLSTSQASFSGLDDAIPTLQQWHIRLASKGSGILENNVLQSREEFSQQQAHALQQKTAKVPKPRSEMFGIQSGGGDNNLLLNDYQSQLMLLEQQNKKRLMMARQEQDSLSAVAQSQMAQQAMPRQLAMQQMQQQQQQNQMQSMAFSRSAAPSGGLLAAVPPPPAPASRAMPMRMARKNATGWEEEEADEGVATMAFGGDEGTIMPEHEPLDFQESFVEETGFTTSYDLPGLKTLVPRSSASKQRVAKIHFTNVAFSHTTVPKYKPVVYLKAKLRNSSKLTLLRGPAGLTLDGSFIGRTTLPMCSAGDSFTLSLGVDPAIRVTYPKPEVKRTTTGVFNKEDSSVYVRTVNLQNTRATNGKPVKVFVHDQIPVSEDERLKVPLVLPRGLTPGGSAVAAGAPGREGSIDKDWGSAEVRLAKGGNMCWDVNLNAGKAVKLVLEYGVSMPSGEHAIQC